MKGAAPHVARLFLLARIADGMYARDFKKVAKLVHQFPFKQAQPEDLVELLRLTYPARGFLKYRQLRTSVHKELKRNYSEHEIHLLVGEWL